MYARNGDIMGWGEVLKILEENKDVKFTARQLKGMYINKYGTMGKSSLNTSLRTLARTTFVSRELFKPGNTGRSIYRYWAVDE